MKRTRRTLLIGAVAGLPGGAGGMLPGTRAAAAPHSLTQRAFQAFVAALAIALLPTGQVMAAARPAGPAPDLTQGGVKGDSQDCTLGPTGARGWIHGAKTETTDARQVYVTEVDKGSPADGILAVGDVILGLDGKSFASDARISLAKAITEAEKTKGELRLLRWRAGQQATVTLKLSVMGAYSETAPYDCSKSALIFEQGCRALAERMKATAPAKRGNPIVRSLNALALLASGQPEYLPLVREEAQWAAGYSIPDEGGMQSWWYGYVNTFLAEYALATGDASVMPGLRRLTLAIAKGQSNVGTWGHTWANPDTGTLRGYGAMNQPGLSLTMSLILARKVGVKDPAVDRAIARSDLFLSFYIGKGCVPYGDHHPWMQTHEDNGKCGAGTVMFDLLDNARGTEFFSRMCTASYGGERDTGHTGNFYNILWGLPGVSRSGPQATGAWMKEFAWYLDLARRWDGTFLYQGEPGNKEVYDGWDSTGAYLLGYAVPLKKVYLTGKKTSAAPQLDAAAAQAIIADGRDWSPATKAAGYSHRSLEQIFAGLASWSPIVRERSALELARREGDPVPRLLTMLADKDANARHGACQALAALEKRAAPAVPALRQRLGDEDLWLRIQAAEALANMGDAGRTAVPDLLKLLTTTNPSTDPRGMVQRYVTFSLFYPGRQLNVRGLLAKDLQGVDRRQLYPAVEAALQNQDGRARGALGSVYDHLTWEEMQPLMPAVYRAIVEPAPSGEMFADGIRVRGLELLGKYHIQEGLPLCLQLLDIGRWGLKSRAKPCLKVLASYGAAAKSQLPALRKLEAEAAKPKGRGNAFLEDMRQAIATIEAAKDTPPLRSLKYLSKGTPIE